MGSKHGRSPQHSNDRPRAARSKGGRSTQQPGQTEADAARSRRKRPVLRFVVLFIVLMAGFYGVTSMSWYQAGVFPRYLNLNADVSATLLRWLGEEEVRSREQDVLSPRMSLSIAAGCDAIEPSFMFGAAVLAFPAAIKAKLIGVVVGVPLLLLLNLVRILSLFYIGIHAPNWFETVHVDIWQPAYILLALVCWIAWVIWSMRRGAIKRMK